MKQIQAFETPVRKVEFSYKGIHVMVVSETNVVKIWSLKNLE